SSDLNRALNFIALHGKRYLLRHWLVLPCGFVHSRICCPTRPIHLERCWSKSTHDEVAVAVSGAVEITLVTCTEVVTRDHYPVRMGRIIKVHILRFRELRRDGVIPTRFVLRVPVSNSRTSGDVQVIAFFCEFGAHERHPGQLFFGVNLSGPSRYGDAATGDASRFFHLAALREIYSGHAYDCEQSKS